MLGLIVSSFLISTPWIQPHIPEPYLGFGFSLNKQNVTKGDPVSGVITERGSAFKTMASLGVPFQINQFEVFGSRTMRVMLLPEALMGVDYFGGSLAVGPEMFIPTGTYQIPSGFMWGIQLGPHMSSFTAEDVVGNRNTTALLINTYVGPQFDFGNTVALKLQVNPKIFVGRIARGGFRSEWSDLIGAAVFFNAQLQF